MNLGKKAISAVTSAALLASLVATAVAPSAFAATPVTVTGAVGYVTSDNSVPADGASTIVFNFGVPTLDATTGTITVTTTNGRFTNSTGALVIGTTQTIAATAGAGGTADLGNLTLTAPSAAGTATVTVQVTPVGGGTARTDSIQSFTFTAAASTTVSTSWSTSTLSATTAAAVAGSTGVTVLTKVRDTNNAVIGVGASVTWTLSGNAYFTTGGTVTTASATQTNTAGSDGTTTSNVIFSTGVAGVVTVNTTVTYLGTTYTLAAQTLTLVGAVSKITVINNTYSVSVADTVGTGSGNAAIEAALTDAAGNAITGSNPAGLGLVFSAGTYTPANIFTVNFSAAGSTDSVNNSPFYDSADKAYDFNVACVTTGTGTVTIKAATTIGTTTTTVTSLPVTIVCARALSATHVGTMDIAAAATSVAANGTVAINVTVKDDNGLPAPDGTSVLAVTNGVGNVVSSKGVGTKGTVNGVAKFTFLAPANAGSATVTAFVSNATPSSKAVTITIGAGAPVPGVSSHAASALGVTKSGPFTTATKLPVKGKYVTVKFFGLTAGSSVVVMVASKSGTTWSAFAPKSTRVADASGNVYFYWKSASAAWLSFMVSGGNSVQARWR